MASDQAPELEPCRHCGCTDVRLSETSRSLMPWFIECYRGDCGANIGYRETAAEAIAAWNRRADASPLPPQGSAAEAEMVERALKAFRDAVVSGERMNDGAMLAALRAAFAKGGESDA